MEVPCDTPAQVAASLTAASERPWRRLVAPTVVVTAGGVRTFETLRIDGVGPTVTVHLESGGALDVGVDDGANTGEAVVVDGTERYRIVAVLPSDVPIGEHRLEVQCGPWADSAVLLVVPDSCPMPAPDRRWGWQVQLYAMRSEQSWGIGDLADLALLLEVSGRDHGADFVLVNPLHAHAPVLPRQPSPYSPSSRRAFDPLYLRPERCDGWSGAIEGPNRDRLLTLQSAARALDHESRIDRGAAFALKDESLRMVAAQPLDADRRSAFDRFRSVRERLLDDVMLAFALSQHHGADVTAWPADLRTPSGAAIQEHRVELADEIEYQYWLQWQIDEQLEAAQSAALAAGMQLGLMTDLAVGVDGAGADVWSLADDLAPGVRVGAPPDLLAQLGQDWGLPPLRPDRLEATGYEAFRQIVRANVSHAGGLRIDHVMGLWRLFWIPPDGTAADGTYVRYDADAMLGVLAFEAHRAGAIVVGEDLGTVEDGVRETMAVRGVLGSAVFWFERPDRTSADRTDGESIDRPAHSHEYRTAALTSVTTHDLATVAGWLTDEPTRIRAALDQLAVSVDVERRIRRAERDGLLDLLVAERLLASHDRADVDAVILAVHAFVARTPSTLVAASIADAVGDLRQPNLPGTVDQYPNWRLPIATPSDSGDDADTDGLLPTSAPVMLDELVADERVVKLARTLVRERDREVTHG